MQFDTVTEGNSLVAITSTLCYFAVTQGYRERMPEQAQFSRQIERLASSQILHGSESLCKLLRYLAKHASDHPGVPLKEYQIATEVFGRPADFDPQLDSTIRVQAGRLRAKLAEYYSAEGADDPIVVELPKGTYVLSSHHRAPVNKPHGAMPGEANGDAARQPALSSSNAAVIALATLLVISGIVIAGLLMARKPGIAASAAQPDSAPAAFRLFWRPFIAGPGEPWVIFSNAAFVGRPESGLRYYDSTRDRSNPIFDHYTGVGEVLAVHNLDDAFAQLGRRIRIKRGSLFSLDDAENNNLIFVGSPSENLTLTEIPGTQEFVFQRLASGQRRGDLAIVNTHPQPGEEKAFLASPANAQLTEDYAVIALMRGSNPSRSVLILAGTTTFGTQGAAEYVCRPDSLEELLLRLSVSSEGEVKPFEALLHVKIARGVPVETQLVALRKRSL